MSNRSAKNTKRQDCLQVTDGKQDTADRICNRTALPSIQTHSEGRVRPTQDSFHFTVSTMSKENFPKLDRRNSVTNSKTTISVRNDASPNSAATSSFISDGQGNSDKYRQSGNGHASSVDIREGNISGSGILSKHQNIIVIDNS